MAWGIYARVSTEEQASEGLSIGAQLSALREHFRQKGLAVREYVDAGKSAWTEDVAKRPKFNAMLGDARAGQLEGIGVTHLDRFSRKLIVTLTVLGELGQRGVGFVSLENAAFDFSRPADRLLLAVLGAFAQYYSDELSRKIQRGLLTRASKGLHVGTIPFGYCSGRCPGCDDSCTRWGKIGKGDPPIVHPDDFTGVALAFETYRLGTHTDSTIAAALNAAGYRSRTAQGRVLWNKHSAAWLLSNPFYAGQVTIKGKEFQGAHQALISQELFDEVQAVRARHYGAKRTYAPKHRVYLFAGILTCSGCGRKMRGLPYGKGNEYRGYRCRAEESKKVECAKSQGIVPAQALETQFGEIVKRITLPADWRERVLAMLVQNGKPKNVESRRRGLQEKRTRIKWLYTEGDLSQLEYSRKKQEIDDALHGLELPREREVIDAGAYLQDLAAAWGEATLAERREMTLALLTGIVCDPDVKRITALVPRPAFAPIFRQLSHLKEREGVFEVIDQAR